MAASTQSLAERARDEAYASAPSEAFVWHVVTLDTPAFEAPLHFIAAAEADTPIVLETGERVEAIACAFDLVPPGFGDSGPTAARLKIDGVSSDLYPQLKQAVGGGAIRVVYRAYLGSDLATVVDLIEGLQLKRVKLTATAAEGELTYAEIATQAFPRRTYDLETFPANWNA